MVIKARVLESTHSSAVVETIPPKLCVGCKGCSHAKIERIPVLADKKYHVNSIVEVSLENSSVLKASLYAYLLPLIAFLSGLFGGSYFFNIIFESEFSEVFGLLMGIFLMLLVFLAVKKGEPKRCVSGEYLAKIIDYDQEELCHF